MMKKQWSGIFPATMVPLKSDYTVNEKELRDYIEWVISHKDITGVVTNGHTGEVSGFTPKERKEITRIVADQVAGRAKVVSGVCAEGSYEAIEHARDAKEAGADGILLMPPHIWLRFGMKPETPLKYFQDVADAVDIKIIVHLYPSMTKAFYPVETLLKMSEIPNVVAVKVGTRDMALYERDVRILKEKAPHLSILTCHDEFLASTMMVGVDGALVGFAGCVPELITGLFEAVKTDDLKEIRKVNDLVQPMSAAIYGVGQPSAEAHARMKEAIHQRGKFGTALMRPPVLPLSQEEKDLVTRALKIAQIK